MFFKISFSIQILLQNMTGYRNLEGKMEARKRDRERKRRDQLTPTQLDQVRSTQKKYKKFKRNNMSEMEKEKAREIRNMKNTKKLKRIRNAEDLKEMKKIDEALRKRKYRSQLSEKEKNKAKLESKVGMASGRKKGFLTTYKQRKKRDKNELYIWKRFINQVDFDLFKERNSNRKDVIGKLASLKRQIRDFESQKREEANRYRHFRWVWKGRDVKKKEEVCNKHIVKMRQYRTKIKEKINIEDFKTIKCRYDTSESEDECDNEDFLNESFSDH